MSLPRQVDEVCDEVGKRVVDHHIAIEIAHVVTRRRWWQVAVKVGWQRGKVADVAVGEKSSYREDRTPCEIDGAQMVEVVTP